MMVLDFAPATNTFLLSIPRGRDDAMVNKAVKEFGLDLSSSASTGDTAVCYTTSPYAAAPFSAHATRLAMAQPHFRWIVEQSEASRKSHSDAHFDVPYDKELASYQKADLEYMLARAGKTSGVLDADEPGLGKTMTAIAYCNEVRAKRVAIVCPAGIRYQWLARFNDWTTMDRYLPAGTDLGAWAINGSKNGVPTDCAVLSMSYEMARAPGIHEALLKQEFDVLILDETHMLKTSTAARTRALFGGVLKRPDGVFRSPGLASRSQHVVMLTGTPLPNRPREAFVAANNCCPDSIDFLNEHAFGDRFNPVEKKEISVWDEEQQRWVTKVYTDESSGRHAELQARLRSHFMTRHLKREVLTQLKLPVYDLVIADETAPVRAALEAESFLEIDPETLTGQHKDILGNIAEARHMMGVALAPQAGAYCGMLLEGGVEKLVVFYWHVDVGGIIGREIQKHLADDETIVRVDGSTSAKAKEAAKRKFVDDPKCRVIMGNILTLGTGTDELQFVSSHCVIAEPDWVPGNNVQCVDRLDRHGQKRTVNADIFVAPNSIAERVLASALRKAQVTHSALDKQVA